MTATLTQQLSHLLGADAVLPPEGYAVDGVVPQAVCRPTDRAGVLRALRWAAEQQMGVFPRGGGVLAALGNTPAQSGMVLDLSRLDRVLDYQPADLTATAEAGVTLESLRRELVQGGKFAPLAAPLPERATVGGILAANYSGPLRYAHGLPRDWLIGISVAGADGIESKAGGKVVKNVTGYDLNKLYTGSLGTLGVILEATFKLAPRPDAGAALVAGFPALSTAIAAARALIAQVYAPQGLPVVNRAVSQRLGLDIPGGGEALALAFLAGRPRSVARRVEESARLLREWGAGAVADLEEDEGQSLLGRLTDLGWGDDTRPTLGLKVNLPPAETGGLVASLNRSEDLGIVADPGFGVVNLLWWRDTPDDNSDGDAGDVNAIMAEIETARQAAHARNGTVVVEQCPLPVKAQIDVWQGAAGAAELAVMRRIKENFDPAGILNPGRFIGKL